MPLVLLVLSACGNVGVDGYGAPEPRRGTGGPPAPRAAPSQGVTVEPLGGSDPAFVNATAVIVGRGDSVYALARRHRVSARAIIEANNLRPPYHLIIGQRIILPRDRVHVVARGESLYGVSRRYDVSTYAIARANDLRPPYGLDPGQRLRIPAAGTDAAAGPSARPRRR
ncbi:MAG: LysM peptidoglycan-binding domain-containing protein [Hyphomicrobiales bacterium]|nr:LysM peptidoglycan-binding domain-containing protein [Hyphomicrobiales bacterium]